MSNKQDIQMEQAEITSDVEKQNAKNTAETQPKAEPTVIKKGGSGLAFLALLVALGVGGAGYYFGQLEVNKINQKFTALEQQIAGKSQLPQIQVTTESSAINPELADALANLKATNGKLAALEIGLMDQNNAFANLQTQVAKLNNNNAAQPNDWLLSEADFLLANALRKLVLDNDVDTSISLLKISDEVLTKVSDPEAKTVRAAINQDLKQLLSLNSVDQNAIMQRLSQLANSVDELVALNVNFGDENLKNTDKVSDDVNDWKANLEKTATSFMNHFVRITPRSDKATQALLAPNQEIYLRENIRLRLQIAILAVPRQQNELYKQSLEAVAAWVRSYFDTTSELATNFLKSVDELSEQSIYIEVPNQLSSLNALDKLLNKPTQEIQKVEISADKGLVEANQVAAEEIKAESAKSEETQSDVAPQATETTPQQ